MTFAPSHLRLLTPAGSAFCFSTGGGASVRCRSCMNLALFAISLGEARGHLNPECELGRERGCKDGRSPGEAGAPRSPPLFERYFTLIFACICGWRMHRKRSVLPRFAPTLIFTLLRGAT